MAVGSQLQAALDDAGRRSAEADRDGWLGAASTYPDVWWSG